MSEKMLTLWEYDAQGLLDYFLPELGNNDPSDGTIACFNITTAVGISENQAPSALADSWALW
jgi:hypothetical protein